MLAKARAQPVPDASFTHVSFRLDLVSADLWGPVRVPSVGDKSKYVLSLVDHATRMVWSYPIPTKESKVVQARLEQWRLRAERQADKNLKTLRTDGGKEFLGEVEAWMKQLGISRQRSAPYTPSQNGVVERWHRTMGEGIRTLLLQSGLPASFWGEALRHVVWTYIRTAHSALPGCTTPLEAWSGRKPELGMLRVWGCMGCVRLPEPTQDKQGKLAPRGVMCVCLGVDEEAKAWRMLDPAILKVRVTKDVEFMEHVPWKTWAAERTGGMLGVEVPEAILQLLPPAPAIPEGAEELQELGTAAAAPLPRPVQQAPQPQQGLPEVEEEETGAQARDAPVRAGPVTRSATRRVTFSGAPQEPPDIVTPPPPDPVTAVVRERPSMTRLLLQQIGQLPSEGGEPALEEALADAACVAALFASQGEEPTTAAEALSGPQAAEWRAAIQAEMQAMVEFGVWDPELVELPEGKTAVDSKLVFKIKTNEKGEVVKYKARFVARGFSQRPGEDFGETYSPVAMMPTVRLLIALAAVHGWPVHVVDVNNAFLNAPLTEEIYLRQPAGADDGTGRVFRLRKALYGLKQAPLLWNEELGKHLTDHGFVVSHCDPSLFILHGPDGSTFIPTWVDDLLVVATSEAGVGEVKGLLGEKFAIKDLGEVSTYLGMQVRRDKGEGWIDLSMEKYIRHLTGKFGDLLQGRGRVQTPMSPDSMRRMQEEEEAWT
jgi:hypothetical protein